MEREEYYNIDINEEGSLVVYGGKSEILYISDFPTLKILHRVDDFEDSIIFTKFIETNYFVVATYNGIVCLYFYENDNYTEVNRIDIEEDISKIEYFGTSLVIGTSKGSIHFFRNNFANEIFLTGQDGEIRDMFLHESKLYTLSQSKVVIFDIDAQAIHHEFGLVNFMTMCLSPLTDKLLVASEYESMVIKSDRAISCYRFGGENILFVNNIFISGGDYCSINFIDPNSVNNTCHRYDFALQNEKCEGISKIISLGQSIIAFSTFCGKIGAGDYTKPSSFRFYDAGVGIVFDFKFYYRHILVCGSNGVNAIDL